MARHKCSALAASLLSCIATGFAPALSNKRQLVPRAHSDDAAAAALDSFDDLASLERRLATLDDGVVPKLRGF